MIACIIVFTIYRMINYLPRNWNEVLGDINVILLNKPTYLTPYTITDVIRCFKKVLVVINDRSDFYTNRCDNVTLVSYEDEADLCKIIKVVEDLKPELVFFDNSIYPFNKNQKLHVCQKILEQHECRILVMFHIMATTSEKELFKHVKVCLAPISGVNDRRFPRSIPVFLYNDNEYFNKYTDKLRQQ